MGVSSPHKQQSVSQSAHRSVGGTTLCLWNAPHCACQVRGQERKDICLCVCVSVCVCLCCKQTIRVHPSTAALQSSYSSSAQHAVCSLLTVPTSLGVVASTASTSTGASSPTSLLSRVHGISFVQNAAMSLAQRWFVCTREEVDGALRVPWFSARNDKVEAGMTRTTGPGGKSWVGRRKTEN